MADTEPSPGSSEVEDKWPSGQTQQETPAAEEDMHEDAGSHAASEDTDERAPPTSSAPQTPADMPTPTPPTPKLNVPEPEEADSRRTAEFFDQRMHSERSRTDSQSTAATAATTATRPSTRSSLVFVITALENIAASKDAKKNKKLGDSVATALAAIKAEGDPSRINPETLFQPLQLASEAPSVPVSIVALDCIGKLISYSYFSVPSEPQGDNEAAPLIEKAIDTICECFQGEATPPDVQLQIVKSLLAAILNDKIVVHGAGLLKAVRLTYNIFLLSKSSANQQVAQGALTQMVGTVFERVKSRLAAKEARVNLSRVSLNDKDNSEEHVPEEADVDTELTNGTEIGAEDAEEERYDPESGEPSDKPVDKHTGPKITLQSFENNMSFNDDRIHDNAPTLVTRIKGKQGSRQVSGVEASPNPQEGEGSDEEEEDEIFVKDAYLVFRAMCRLSTKTLAVDHALDVKSQGMRSKLLSLHIIHTILHNNIAVFISPYATIRSGSGDEPTTFVQAIKQYLCLSLSRNGASSVNKVFEVACEIFWHMLKYLRVMLKKEVEVFLKEIYLATLDKRSAPAFQKQYILTVFRRLAADPRALVEIYLNYDCDRTALDNMYQRVVEHLSKISSTPVTVSPMQQQAYQEQREKQAKASDWQTRGTLPPSLSTASMNVPHESEHAYPPEYAMKQESLEGLVEILRSLVNWSEQSVNNGARNSNVDLRGSVDNLRASTDNRTISESPNVGGDSGTVTPMVEDDYGELEKAKQKKTALTRAVREFNYKPKRGIKTLIKEGFIASNSPEDIARFFHETDLLDKGPLGEFLGEGDEENIKIMHAFVDQLDFTKTRFTDALRRFLQCFRLPGEAQKIDRFMLKFAERYITGNPNAYANADTAYVLSYSVIMLNVDQHSKKMKGPRMTPEDFIKNNRGINDGADLPEEYLRGIYEEIASKEIVLETEQEAAADKGLVQPQQQGGLVAVGQALIGGGRDLQREVYVQASEAMANKTEQLYKQLLRAQRKTTRALPVSKFIPASSSKHVGPMFEVTWMPFLTALSGQAQDHNIEIVRLCLEGIKLAIRISCIFDVESARQAFVAFLARFTNLYNLSEMKAKNMEALKILIEIANTEGNLLQESWREVLTCVSQLDRFQLISAGIDERSVPDVLKTQSQGGAQSRKSLNVPNNRRRQISHTNSMQFQADVAEESRSTDIVRGVDRIFTSTANLSGEAIVDFVKALTQVSWQEIQSSGQSESPRTYSLQKLVEISGYNMTRVRFEWTNIWQILGAHFNEVGCHTNTNVVYFALNSLRQLSMKFMEIEELPGFKFQKDFLKPFEHIISNASVVSVKDMVLRCLIQMIQARGENIRSGWKTMFGVFTVAAREPYEGIVNLAFENVSQVYNTRFGVVISQGAFADLIVCLTEFSKNYKFQKKSLQAIELLKSSVPKMLRTPECSLSARAGFVKESDKGSAIPKQPTRQTQEEQFWFPVLFAFHDVLMTGEDLEVRSRALSYLFETLITYGRDFPRDFWDMLWRQLLYPIFMVLKSKSEMSKVLNHEELSVWLSTTMIQALRNMVRLFTHFFDSLEYMLDRFLDLLALCICQENDTLARIGSNCLQQLILQNVQKFTPQHWNQIVRAFVDLFARTEATALMSAATAGTPSQSQTPNGFNGVDGEKTPTAPPKELSLQTPSEEESTSHNALGINGLNSPRRPSVVTNDSTNSLAAEQARMPSPLPKRQTQELEDYRPEDQDVPQPPVVVTAARRRFFNQIITKCVLQLLMIETVQELFTNDAVYEKIPSGELLRLMAVLKKSYHFAKRFNADRDLRTRLFREGFMKQPPNLLKQESGSASVYVSILFRMYHDTSTDRAASRADTEAALIPLCEDIISSYIELDEETQQRNIVTWRPVVVSVLDGYCGFPPGEFEKHVEVFAPLVVGLLGTELAQDIQRAVQALVMRVFESKVGIERVPLMTPAVRSPRGSFHGSPKLDRKASRGK